MQNDDDSPDTDKSLPPDRTVISGAGTDDGPERTRIVTNALEMAAGLPGLRGATRTAAPERVS